MPTLKDAQIMKKPIGQTILLIAVIADLVTMILLAVFASVYDKSGNSNTWLILILFGVGVILYFIGKQFKTDRFLRQCLKVQFKLTRAPYLHSLSF